MFRSTFSKINAALSNPENTYAAAVSVSAAIAAYISYDCYRTLNRSHHYHMIVRPPLTNGPGIVEEHKEVNKELFCSRP